MVGHRGKQRLSKGWGRVPCEEFKATETPKPVEAKRKRKFLGRKIKK